MCGLNTPAGPLNLSSPLPTPFQPNYNSNSQLTKKTHQRPHPPDQKQPNLRLTSHVSGPHTPPGPLTLSSPLPTPFQPTYTSNSHFTSSTRGPLSMGLSCQPLPSTWIFNCGATNTMTYTPSDLFHTTPTTRTQIQTVNGDCVVVTKTGTVQISPSINLRNCLLIPSLTHKLLSVSQLTKELDCNILMTSSDCVQDAQTGTIIRHGTELGALYYVDATTQHSQAMLTRGSTDYQLRIWHRRLGHPSLVYLKVLFPSLKSSTTSLDCETCVLAKSHKHAYLPSVTHSTSPFVLIHFDV